MEKDGRLVYGVGVNDADYVLTRYEKIDGKYRQVWICPFYQKWRHVLERCYSETFLSKNPTYRGCSVCDEWLTFSNFKTWMEQQDWQGKHLDKDLLKEGNRVYCPEYCIFVDILLNSFVTDRRNARGRYMIGVTYKTPAGTYISQCCNLSGHAEVQGRFNTELEAHLAWKKRKHELACQLADSEYCTDPRLAEALRTRYL